MKKVPLLIFGVGGVGQALLRQLVAGREALARRNGLAIQVAAVADSRGCLWAPEGLSDEQIEGVLAAKKAGRPVAPASDMTPVAVVEAAAAAGLKKVQVVDVTAVDGLEALLDRALELDFGVVLANKKPLAAPWAAARRYFNHPRLRHESTVGGGQPVIAALRYLLDTNDPVVQIEGQMSGTLGYICGRLDEGVPFSQAVAEAKAKGYTEPDPREDLGGQDVMRKILILGRLAGWPLEAEDIDVESLYHPSLAHLSAPEFMAAVVAMDPTIADRVRAAGAAGEVLRYVARLTAGGGAVGLTAVPLESPLANLKYISFETGHYADQPLMIGGKGAGVEMTAAGVVGDVIGLAREWQSGG